MQMLPRREPKAQSEAGTSTCLSVLAAGWASTDMRRSITDSLLSCTSPTLRVGCQRDAMTARKLLREIVDPTRLVSAPRAKTGILPAAIAGL